MAKEPAATIVAASRVTRDITGPTSSPRSKDDDAALRVLRQEAKVARQRLDQLEALEYNEQAQREAGEADQKQREAVKAEQRQRKASEAAKHESLTLKGDLVSCIFVGFFFTVLLALHALGLCIVYSVVILIGFLLRSARRKSKRRRQQEKTEQACTTENIENARLEASKLEACQRRERRKAEWPGVIDALCEPLELLSEQSTAPQIFVSTFDDGSGQKVRWTRVATIGELEELIRSDGDNRWAKVWKLEDGVFVVISYSSDPVQRGYYCYRLDSSLARYQFRVSAFGPDPKSDGETIPILREHTFRYRSNGTLLNTEHSCTRSGTGLPALWPPEVRVAYELEITPVIRQSASRTIRDLPFARLIR
jgi:F0F1-type ATP synthase assembly protein I